VPHGANVQLPFALQAPAHHQAVGRAWAQVVVGRAVAGRPHEDKRQHASSGWGGCAALCTGDGVHWRDCVGNGTGGAGGAGGMHPRSRI